MTSILLIVAGLLLVLTVTALVAGVANAQEGYEDETGFHFVAKQRVSGSRRHVSVTVRSGSEKRPIRIRQSAA